MKIIKIPKKDKSFRVIYCPEPELKKRLRLMVPRLNGFAIFMDRHGVAHGFMPRRSPVTNAMAHCGFPFSLSFDLENWFDTVTPDHVMNVPGLMSDATCLCFVDGAARQGLPTSPAMANIAAAPMDNDIMALRVRGRLGWSFGAYTRYADDMTFSFEREATARWLKEIIPPLVERHKFKINPAKTRLQSARAGRRIITGVAVDDTIHVPRKIKRRLRAARHQRNWPQMRGLGEWARLRLPGNYQPPTPPLDEQIIQTVSITYVAADTYVHATFIRRIT